MKTKIIPSNPKSDIAIKYLSRNPIIKLIIQNFLNNFIELSHLTNPQNIIELGAGEGYLSYILASQFPKTKIIVSDISSRELASRKYNLKNFKNAEFEIINAKKIKYPNNKFDLIVCSEVLEHISNPQKALKEIYRTTNKYALLSVPNEPIFHLLNLLRGKYITTWGNYPDHINHWSKNKFIEFITHTGFKIIKIKMPLPWTMLLVEK